MQAEPTLSPYQRRGVGVPLGPGGVWVGLPCGVTVAPGCGVLVGVPAGVGVPPPTVGVPPPAVGVVETVGVTTRVGGVAGVTTGGASELSFPSKEEIAFCAPGLTGALDCGNVSAATKTSARTPASAPIPRSSRRSRTPLEPSVSYARLRTACADDPVRRLARQNAGAVR
jgi:hypothetical protein